MLGSEESIDVQNSEAGQVPNASMLSKTIEHEQEKIDASKISFIFSEKELRQATKLLKEKYGF